MRPFECLLAYAVLLDVGQQLRFLLTAILRAARVVRKRLVALDSFTLRPRSHLLKSTSFILALSSTKLLDKHSTPSLSPLILRRSTHGELEVDDPSGQPLVHLLVRVESVIHATPLLLVQHDLQVLATILRRPRALSHNLDRVHEVAQDGVVHGRQGAGAGTLLR